jgi:hypothetical protein
MRGANLVGRCTRYDLLRWRQTSSDRPFHQVGGAILLSRQISLRRWQMPKRVSLPGGYGYPTMGKRF